MEYKPWPLLILAFFHFIEPFSKITFYSVFFNLNPIDIISVEITQGSARHIFEYFFLFPIAGIAIFAVKKWSLSVFLVVELWVFISNVPYIQELYADQQYLLAAFFIVFAILNVTVVSYLLIPAVNVAYMDPKVRWWEAKPRYTINAKCSIDDNAATIRDISESGVFIYGQNELEVGSEIQLKFAVERFAEKFVHNDLNILAKVVHHFTIDEHPGYGVKFIVETREDRRIIRKLIRTLDASDAKRRPARLSFNSLLVWAKTLIHTGKGLMPSSAYLESKKASE